MNKEKVLEVKDLTVSFKTPNGLVRAVRGISLDLYKAETLVIVGESGSGKSVTARAMMGILARNAIIDDGEINYRNQDLTKLSEANFHKIRGSKIGMIFQDPLSSLNPIMRIGKQITEAMLVNGNHLKSRYHDLYHNEYHDYLNKLQLIKLSKENIINKKNDINDDESLSKEQKAQKISDLKKDMHGKIKTYKHELPALKKRYLAKKSESKKIVNKEKKQILKEEKVTYLKLKDALNSLKVLLKNSQSDFEKNDLRSQIKAQEDKLSDNKENFKRRFKVTKKEAFERAIDIMNEVGIPEAKKRFRQYPFQFSGGMRQRIVIAIALTADPDVLICDEPTTALDVTIQGQILTLLKDLKKERGLSVIFITHDLGVVANLADRVAVMYAGKIVEYGNSEDVFYHPKHPYTWALLSSVPDLDTSNKLLSIPGTPPDMLFPPKGDAFAPRNRFALKIDFEAQPPFFKVSDTHYAATWLLHKDAPKVEMPGIINDRIQRYQQQIIMDKEKRTKQKLSANEGEQVE